MQQQIIDAMVESGASAEDVAKAVVKLKLLEAIGSAPEKMAKELLAAIRAGDEISRDKLESILQGGGIDADAAAMSALLQKCIGRCGADPEDVARAILLQKAMAEGGASPENIAKVNIYVSVQYLGFNYSLDLGCKRNGFKVQQGLDR
jgi:ribosomal protein L12E/L44/L45/RPP1/RPP2